MKLYRFDREVGGSIQAYHSSGFVIARLAHLFDEAVVNCAYLEANGVIGYHQATIPQLFLVVQGEGWVRSETNGRVSIKTGEAAYWEQDEWHESGTETGMTAIIIEGGRIDLSKLMSTV